MGLDGRTTKFPIWQLAFDVCTCECILRDSGTAGLEWSLGPHLPGMAVVGRLLALPRPAHVHADEVGVHVVLEGGVADGLRQLEVSSGGALTGGGHPN